jgi:hypothetical protein
MLQFDCTLVSHAILHIVCNIPSVHCAGLSDDRGACQYVVSGQTAGAPDQPRRTEVHSFGNHLISKSVSVTPRSFTEASLYNALFCVFMALVRYNLEQRVFFYDCYA